MSAAASMNVSVNLSIGVSPGVGLHASVDVDVSVVVVVAVAVSAAVIVDAYHGGERGKRGRKRDFTEWLVRGRTRSAPDDGIPAFAENPKPCDERCHSPCELLYEIPVLARKSLSHVRPTNILASLDISDSSLLLSSLIPTTAVLTRVSISASFSGSIPFVGQRRDFVPALAPTAALVPVLHFAHLAAARDTAAQILFRFCLFSRLLGFNGIAAALPFSYLHRTLSLYFLLPLHPLCCLSACSASDCRPSPLNHEGLLGCVGRPETAETQRHRLDSEQGYSPHLCGRGLRLFDCVLELEILLAGSSCGR